MNVLKVDLTGSDASQKFCESLKHTGFAVLRNHPIDPSLVKEVYADWEKFFADNSKFDYHYNPDLMEGFFPQDVSEIARGYDIKDIKEFYHYLPWGRKPAIIGDATDRLFRVMTDLAAQLLTWIEQETPDDIRQQFSMPLADMIQDSDQEAPGRYMYTRLRILHYPPLTGDEPEGAVRAAAHGDSNLITLLPAATDAGLQVQDRNGDWQDVSCDPGTIIVNTGDMLNLLTRGYYPSTIHRVINPVGAAADRSRLSLPLFFHPRDDVQLNDEYTAVDYWRMRMSEHGLFEDDTVKK